MKKLNLLLLGLIITVSLTAQTHRGTLIAKVDQMLESALEKEHVYNAFLSIYSPSKDFEWHVAKGAFKDGRKVTTEHPYYTASIGKTFTASGIGILADQGKLQFDDPIAKYLSDEIMSGLHVLIGTDYGDSIRISHLLQHTSGLPDYFDEQTTDGSPGIFDLIMTKPDQFWQPATLIAFSKAHFRPSFPPGQGYFYTDTEYVLLGMIIENISALELHEFFAKNIFVPLAMHHTYLNLRSEALQPTGKIAEIYADDFEISQLRSLSADWAGGAIVSTGKDLIIFMEALMDGEIVSNETLQAMQQWIPETQGMTYGYGLRKINFAELSPGLPDWEVIGHSGLNGTSMYYCPDLDIYLAGTLNQLSSSKEAVALALEVLMEFREL